MTTTNTHIVTIKDNTVVTNSLDVAAYFAKRHDNVLADVDHPVAEGVLNFQETSYVHPQNKQTYRSFDMTRDDFTILAMGFTGKKATIQSYMNYPPVNLSDCF